jgi:beta-aspartyl-peptidase (threonine type)
MPMAILVHGGAGSRALPPELPKILQAGCKEAAQIGWRVLEAGGSALDAVEAAVRSLEDNPYFNAGTGASMTTGGKIELDAGMMDGHALAVGAVADVELIKNPISLARKVLVSPHVLLVGKGAQQFAQEQGIPLCKREDLMTGPRYQHWLADQSPQAQNPGRPQGSSLHLDVGAGLAPAQDSEPFYTDATQEKHGTVGAVALDGSGHLAAATSTGGIPNKYPGRVGDSPLVGCGFYADENAAISCTGHGEDFVRLLIAKRASDFVAQSENAQRAAESAIAVLTARASGTGGLIVIDHLGNVGFAWNTQHMSHAYIIDGMSAPATGI